MSPFLDPPYSFPALFASQMCAQGILPHLFLGFSTPDIFFPHKRPRCCLSSAIVSHSSAAIPMAHFHPEMRKLWEYNTPWRHKHPYCLLRVQNYYVTKFFWLNPSLQTSLHSRPWCVTQGKLTFFCQEQAGTCQALCWRHSPPLAVPTQEVFSLPFSLLSLSLTALLGGKIC